MHIQFFVNIVNFMRYILDPEKNNEKSRQNTQFSEKSVFVREDDQDWGSSGMNDIQTTYE